MTTSPVLLTIPEAAVRLGCGRLTVYRRIAAGELEAVDTAPRGSTRTRLRVPDTAITAYIDALPRVVEPQPAHRPAARRTRTRRPAKV